MPPVKNVEIPHRMRKLKRDRRGYPIPYMTAIGKDRKPMFTVNDSRMVRRCLMHNRCSICGDKLAETCFFVGGIGSAMHPNGGYVDPAMHRECATYALMVCPFLAVPKYLGDKPTYVLGETETHAVVEDTGVVKGKPTIFMLKETHGYVNMGDFIKVRLVPTDTVSLESWQHGEKLDDDDPRIDEAIANDLGAIEDMHGRAGNAASRSPMLTSMAAFAPILRR